MDKNILIDHIVREFYKRATEDVLIGYQFKKIIDFESHIPKIVLFWKNQLLNESPHTAKEIHLEFPSEGFNLIKTHRPLHIHKGEVGRWATLFNQTLNDEKKKLDQTTGPNILGPQRDAYFVLLANWSKKIALFEKKFMDTPLLFRGTSGPVN